MKASVPGAVVASPARTLAFLLVAFFCIPTAAFAAGLGQSAPTSVAGHVVNHTKGGGALSGVTVTLREYQNQQFQSQLQTTTDSSGAYHFDSLSADPSVQYLPVVQYQNVTYTGDAVRLADAQSNAAHDDVVVYDTTTQDPGLRYENATLVLGGVVQATQHLTFLELLTLDNPSDRTYVPTASAQGMATNLVRFSLPAGVDDIGVESGLDSASLIQVDRGLASTLPVAPGSHTISFSFAVPYTASTFSFAWNVIYPAAAIHVLAPTNGPPLNAGTLTAAANLALQGRTFRVLDGGAVGANTTVAISLSRLPGRTPVQALQAALPQGKALPVAALSIAALAAFAPVLYLWRRRTGRDSAPALTADALLDELAALDDAHGRGEVDEPSYTAQRTALKARLAKLLPTAQPDGSPTV